MIKKIFKTLLITTLLFSFGMINVNAEENLENTKTSIDNANSSGNQYDIKIDSNNKSNGSNSIENNLDILKLGKNKDFIGSNRTGELGIYYLLVKIAQSLKDIFLAIASVYFLIIILKLLFSEGSSEEEFGKFKKGLQWITTGIIVMQIAYSYVNLIYNKKIGAEVSGGLIENIIEPLLKLLETAASFFFVGVMIFAFYKLITSGGEEEKAKQGKLSVGYAFIGFVVIQLSRFIVSAIYSKTLCKIDKVNCTNPKDLSDGAKIIFTVINWLNGFVGIVVVIMIIYAGSQIIFSNGEDEKIKKAKKSILYIIIGIVLLTVNYFILTFFLTPELIN